MSDSREYKPIACATYDELALFSMRRCMVEVEVRQDTGVPKTYVDRISDVFTRGTAEYLRLDAGKEIRLDDVVSVRELSDT